VPENRRKRRLRPRECPLFPRRRGRQAAGHVAGGHAGVAPHEWRSPAQLFKEMDRLTDFACCCSVFEECWRQLLHRV